MFKEELEDLKNRYLARRAIFARFSREAVDSPLDSGRLDREVDFTADTTSRLDAAARAGLDVPFSCKCGVCAACRAKLIDGRVCMGRNLALAAADHVARLEGLVRDVKAQRLAPAAEFDALIRRFTAACADAQHEHRVLTADVKFLRDAERAAVEAGQRRVLVAIAGAIARERPDLARLASPLAMLLFGMTNWPFTWLKPGGALTHAALAPIVAELHFGGLPAVTAVPVPARKRRLRSAAAALA